MQKRLPFFISPVPSSAIDLVHLNVTSSYCLQNMQNPKYLFINRTGLFQQNVVGTYYVIIYAIILTNTFMIWSLKKYFYLVCIP